MPDDLGINNKFFDYPCFGVQLIKDCFDLTENNVEILKKSKNKQKLKNDILKLAFFDILTCNEDRHWGNLNILAKYENDEFLLYPIDHVAIFNQLNLTQELCELTYQESLINTELFGKILKVRDLPRRKIQKTMKENLYLCFVQSKDSIDEILDGVPPNWQIDNKKIKQSLLDLCFNDNWFNHCWAKFTEYLQIFYNKQR